MAIKFINDTGYNVSLYCNKKLRDYDYDYYDGDTFRHDRIDIKKYKTFNYNWKEGITIVRIEDNDNAYYPNFSDNMGSPAFHLYDYNVVEIYDAEDDGKEGYGFNLLGDEDNEYEFY